MPIKLLSGSVTNPSAHHIRNYSNERKLEKIGVRFQLIFLNMKDRGIPCFCWTLNLKQRKDFFVGFHFGGFKLTLFGQCQLHAQGVLHGQHVCLGQRVDPGFQSHLVSGHDLVGHGFAACTRA